MSPLHFTIIKPTPARQTIGTTPSTIVMLDTVTGLATGPLLTASVSYLVTVTGAVSDWNAPLAKGQPEPDATYPTQHEARKSTQVGIDAETLFAQPSNFSHTLGHWTQFQINTGSGWSHVEPVGGPYSKPVAGHTYTYHLTGKGQPVAFRWYDPNAYADNYGAFRITVQ